MVYYISDSRIALLGIFGFSLGILCALLWDIFRLCRLVLLYPLKKDAKSAAALRAAVIFTYDILFFIIIGLANTVFVFASNDGNVRISAIICEIAGFALWHNSFGILTLKASEAAAAAVNKLMRAALRKTVYPLKAAVVNLLLRLRALYHRARLRRYTKEHESALLTAAERGMGFDRLPSLRGGEDKNKSANKRREMNHEI